MSRPRKPALEVSMAGLPDAPARPLSVDGMAPRGPNLSHWPGNRTPPELKADLSTGICLGFARLPEREREALLAGAQAVVNDHYDTDGFLSMLAVVRPEVALAREEVCLAAAATGDYQSFQTERAFAIDRIVLGLLRSERSPLAAELEGLGGDERALLGYRFLLENAEQVLDHPERLRALWQEELAAVRAELRAARLGGLRRRVHHGARLAVVRGRGPTHRMVLNTVAGAYRVLHVADGPGGPLVRYHDRTESWFEVVTFSPPPRRDLRELAALLQALEGERAEAAGRWCADPSTDPVPELYHGLPGAQEYGEITRTLTPTRLGAEQIEGAVVRFFGEAG